MNIKNLTLFTGGGKTLYINDLQVVKSIIND